MTAASVHISPKDETQITRPVKVATVAFLARDQPTTVEQNLHEAMSWLDRAGSEGADIVCLPEWFNIMNTPSWPNTVTTMEDAGGKEDPSLFEVAETIPGELSQSLARKAKQHSMNIVATFVVKEGDRLFNQATIFDRDGRIRGTYRKMQPTASEARVYGVTPGQELPVFQLDFGKVAILICMDIYFPEIVRIYSLKGAEIVFWPTMAWGPTEFNLETQCRARAMDYSVYVVASNYASEPPYAPDIGKSHIGRAYIIDHEGYILADTGHGAGLAISTIDLDRPRLGWGIVHIRNTDLIREDLERLVRLGKYAEEYLELAMRQSLLY